MRQKRRNSSIPRKNLPARRVVETVNDFNEVVGKTLTNFTLKLCTVQPMVGNDMLALVDGYQNKDCYTIWTQTECRVGKEGTHIKADEIQLYNKWYRVLKVKNWSVGVIPHYEVLVVEIDEGLV
jgi:hypothetical protein